MVTRSLEPIPTGCESLDRMLGGGIRRGEVALVYGEPGTGKTSLAIQCAFLCAKRGLKVIFIDSDNTFSPDRLTQIAGSELDEVSPLIFIFKPQDFREQSLLIENLDNYNLSHIALITVDTVTNLYRVELDSAEGVFALNMKLNRQLAYLNELARAYNTPVLVTSQVRSVVNDNLSERKVEPVANRILKFWAQKIINLESTPNSTVKEATLEKGLNHARNRYLYTLGKNGIVSVNK